MDKRICLNSCLKYVEHVPKLYLTYVSNMFMFALDRRCVRHTRFPVWTPAAGVAASFSQAASSASAGPSSLRLLLYDDDVFAAL